MHSEYGNRYQRRAAAHSMRKARPGLGRVTDADRAFFADHPGRSYYLRKASRPEVLDLAAHHRFPAASGDGYAWFVIVHQIHPGARIRQVAAMPADTDIGAGEARARELWDEGAPSGSLPHKVSTAAWKLGL